MKIAQILEQKYYKGANGQQVPAEDIDAVTTYKYIADGFLIWVCAVCGNREQARLPGSLGTVLICPSCGRSNLLLTSNTDRIVKGFRRLHELERQLNESI